MKKLKVIVGLVALVTIFGEVIVAAAPEPKVFVCKYVGTPGVNESLQTGQNPISVSQNAIKDFKGVGSSFNDAQGRSLVIAFDTGQPEPTCPTTPPNTDTPPTSTPPPTTAPPATTVQPSEAASVPQNEGK